MWIELLENIKCAKGIILKGTILKAEFASYVEQTFSAEGAGWATYCLNVFVQTQHLVGVQLVLTASSENRLWKIYLQD